jgi:hypothetical protein
MILKKMQVYILEHCQLKVNVTTRKDIVVEIILEINVTIVVADDIDLQYNILWSVHHYSSFYSEKERKRAW